MKKKIPRLMPVSRTKVSVVGMFAALTATQANRSAMTS